MLTPTEQEARAREITDDEPSLSFAQCLRIHAKIAAALTREYEAGARAERQHCAEAIQGLFDLLDDGVLVRNIKNDGDAAKYVAQALRVVKALAMAKDVLDAAQLDALRARDAAPPTSKEMT